MYAHMQKFDNLCAFYVMSCHVMSCHVMSCHVMSCHVMSCHVMSCHVMSCHVMSCHVMKHFLSPCSIHKNHHDTYVFTFLLTMLYFVSLCCGYVGGNLFPHNMDVTLQ